MNIDRDGLNHTEEKVSLLEQSDLIEYATWGNYDSQKWFCDVRKLKGKS